MFDADGDGVLSVESELPGMLGELFGLDASPAHAKKWLDEVVSRYQDENPMAEDHPIAVQAGDELGRKPGLTSNGLLLQLQALRADSPADLASVFRKAYYVISGPGGDVTVPQGYVAMPGCEVDAENDAEDDLEAARVEADADAEAAAAAGEDAERGGGASDLPGQLPSRRHLILAPPASFVEPLVAMPHDPQPAGSGSGKPGNSPAYRSYEAQAQLSRPSHGGGSRPDSFMQLSRSGIDFLSKCFEQVQDEQGRVSREYVEQLFHRAPGGEDSFGLIRGTDAEWLPAGAATGGAVRAAAAVLQRRGGNLRFPFCIQHSVTESGDGLGGMGAAGQHIGDEGGSWEISKNQWIAGW